MLQTIYRVTFKTIVCSKVTTILSIRLILQEFKEISFKICIALKKLTEEKVFKGSFEENTVNTEDDTVDSFIPTMNLN